MSIFLNGVKFWQEFIEIGSQIRKSLDNGDQGEINRFITIFNDKLSNISEGSIDFEVSDNGFYELSFLSKGIKTTQFIHSLLKKLAPQSILDNWIINAYSQPLSERGFHSIFKLNDKEIKGVECLIYYEVNEDTKMLNVAFYHPNLVGVEKNQQNQIALYLLEQFIGECEMEARIGSFEVVEKESEQENVCYLPNFYEDICDIVSAYEWVEYSDPTQIYTVYKLEAKLDKLDIRHDMKLIITKHPALQAELINNTYDVCKNFKTLGGSFGYLYYEVQYADEKEAFLRQDIEKQLNNMLYELNIATCIGGAIGEHCTYIDFMVFDEERFDQALVKIKKILPFVVYYKTFL